MWAIVSLKLLKATATMNGVFGIRNPPGCTKNRTYQASENFPDHRTWHIYSWQHACCPWADFHIIVEKKWTRPHWEAELNDTLGRSLGSWEGTGVPWPVVWKGFLEECNMCVVLNRVGQEGNNKGNNISKDMPLRVDVPCLILFSFPHSWWMNQAQDQYIASMQAMWLESGIGIGIELELTPTRYVFLKSLKSWPQLNRRLGLPASPRVASSLPCELLLMEKIEVDSLELSVSLRPSWGHGESGSWHPPFLPRPGNSPSQNYLLYLDPYALLICLPRDCSVHITISFSHLI